MKISHLITLSLVLLCANGLARPGNADQICAPDTATTSQQPMISSKPMTSTTNRASVTDFDQTPPIGVLGYPLGQITTISGVVQQAALDTKSTSSDLLLKVEAINDRPLPKPVLMPFTIFETAQIAKPTLGQSFRYMGYETGGFTGVPSAAFKLVPAVATTNHHFEAIYQILREDLKQVKTQTDLVQFNNQRVQVIGKYVVTDRRKPDPANTGIIGFTGEYIRAAIELADGTRIELFSPDNKQSLRSINEVKTYEGKTASVIGKTQMQLESRRSPTKPINILTTMDGIWLAPAQGL
jgi:hypothetical protein